MRYAETDAQGVVYHANYLKYCERGRTDLLGQSGNQLSDLQDRGWTLVVHEMRLSFKRPARLHDELVVETSAKKTSAFRIRFEHRVLKAGEDQPLMTAQADVVAIGLDGGVVELPEGVL